MVITGVTGFIGKKLCERLLSKNCIVYGIGRNEKILSELEKNSNFFPIKLDFKEYSRLLDILHDKDIDCVYHFAWLSGGKYSTDIDVQLGNIKASYELSNIISKLKCKKFVFAGSYYEFKVLKAPTCDQKKVHDSVFGITKTCATEICRKIVSQQGIGFTNVYIPKIFGPGDKDSSAPVKIIKQLIANQPVRLVEGEYYDDWVYIDDVVEGIIDAANCENGSYYIGNRVLKKFKEICFDMRQALNSQSELLFGEYEDYSYIDYSQLELDKLHNITGFECKCDFKDSIMKLANFIKEK